MHTRAHHAGVVCVLERNGIINTQACTCTHNRHKYIHTSTRKHQHKHLHGNYRHTTTCDGQHTHATCPRAHDTHTTQKIKHIHTDTYTPYTRYERGVLRDPPNSHQTHQIISDRGVGGRRSPIAGIFGRIYGLISVSSCTT